MNIMYGIDNIEFCFAHDTSFSKKENDPIYSLVRHMGSNSTYMALSETLQYF